MSSAVVRGAVALQREGDVAGAARQVERLDARLDLRES